MFNKKKPIDEPGNRLPKVTEKLLEIDLFKMELSQTDTKIDNLIQELNDLSFVKQKDTKFFLAVAELQGLCFHYTQIVTNIHILNGIITVEKASGIITPDNKIRTFR